MVRIKRFAQITTIGFIITVFLILASIPTTDKTVFAQIPTVSVATVTGTPTGPLVSVRPGQNEDFINVRSGPNALYPKIGVLLLGQYAPAKGRSPGGEWILIEYPGVPGGTGWVYASLISITPGELPIVEPPPSPTPQMTQTINPTLAAQFIVTSAPTRLPTFTPAPPLTIPTFQAAGPSQSLPGIPMGLVVVILLTIGILLGVFSLFQRK